MGYVTAQPAQGLITRLEECCRETSICFSTRYYIYISPRFLWAPLCSKSKVTALNYAS